MVNKKKRHAYDHEDRNIKTSDDEITCLDAPSKHHKRTKMEKTVKPKIEKKRSEDDILDGIDVDGATEEEKRQLKEALRASLIDGCRSRPIPDDPGETTRCVAQNTTSVSDQQRVTDADSISELKKVHQQQVEITDDDDDSTQPPSDMEQDEGLHLSEPTMETSKDDTFDLGDEENGSSTAASAQADNVPSRFDTSVEEEGDITLVEENDRTDTSSDVESGSDVKYKHVKKIVKSANLDSRDDHYSELNTSNSPAEVVEIIQVDTDEEVEATDGTERETAGSETDSERSRKERLVVRGSLGKKNLQNRKRAVTRHQEKVHDTDSDSSVVLLNKRNVRKGKKVGKRHKDKDPIQEKRESVKQTVKTDREDLNKSHDVVEEEADTTWKYASSRESQEENGNNTVESGGFEPSVSMNESFEAVRHQRQQEKAACAALGEGAGLKKGDQVPVKEQGKEKNTTASGDDGAGLKKQGKEKKTTASGDDGAGLKKQGKEKNTTASGDDGAGLKKQGKEKNTTASGDDGAGLKKGDQVPTQKQAKEKLVQETASCVDSPSASLKASNQNPTLKRPEERRVQSSETVTLEKSHPAGLKSETWSHASANDWHKKDKYGSAERLPSECEASGNGKNDADGSERENGRSSQQSTVSSQQSSRSDSQHSQDGCELQRHYRAVLPKFQTLEQAKYYCTDLNLNPQQSIKAIYQLFEIYHSKLREEQRKCAQKLDWGDTVKAGSHQEKTLDLKRRGKEYVNLELSDEENSDLQQVAKKDVSKEEKTIESRYGRKIKRCHYQTEEAGDDDLPDLVIEEEHASHTESTLNRTLRRRPLHARTNPDKAEFFSVDTQPYDIDDDSKDFVIENKRLNTSRGNVKMGSSAVNKDKNMNENQNDLNSETIGKENIGLRARVRHDKFEQGSRLIETRQRTAEINQLEEMSRANRIRAEETQREKRDLEEAIRRSKADSQAMLFESQNLENDFHWLNVSCENGVEGFQNPMQRAKLQGYSIPKKQNQVCQGQATGDDENFSKGKNLNETVQDNDTKEKELRNDIENIRNARAACPGRKRKINEPKGKVLVEDTQDVDTEVNELTSQSKRQKRKCFSLDDNSEDESVPDSQGVGDTDSTRHAEDDSGKPATKNTQRTPSPGLLGHVTNAVDAVKNMFTGSKTQEEKSEIVNEEGSQSPVLNKKTRKLYNLTSKKIFTRPDSNKTERSENKEVEDAAFEDFKSFSAEKKVKFDSDSQQYSGHGKSRSPLESEFIEETGNTKGVRKLYSRSSSRESNTSDDISSSQRSNTILDEHGNIYSTQYCEIKKRKGKEESVKSKQEHLKVVPEEEAGQISLDHSSDEDVGTVKFQPVKTYDGKKNITSGLPNQSQQRILGKQSKRNAARHEDKISKYFNVTRKETKIEINSDSDQAEHVKMSRQQYQKEDNVENKFENEDPLIGKSAERSKALGTRDKANRNNPNRNVSDKGDKNSLINASLRARVDTAKSGSRLLNAWQNENPVNRHSLQCLDMDTENPPVVLNNFSVSVTAGNRQRLTDRDLDAVQRLKNVDHDEVRNDRGHVAQGRKRKVSETVTSAGFEGRIQEPTEGTKVAQEHYGSETLGHPDVDRNDEQQELERTRNTKKRHEEVEEVTFKERDVECPLCSKWFPQNIIEQHADNCNGVEEPDNDPDIEEYLSGTSQQPSSQEHIAHHSQHSQHLPDPDDDHSHQEALHFQHQHEADENIDAEISHIMENDVNVIDLARKITSSPGEDGEVMKCYVCDQYIEKNKSEAHVTLCLAKAAKQQQQMEQEGFGNIYQDPEPPTRVLRGQRRADGDGSHTQHVKTRGSTPTNTAGVAAKFHNEDGHMQNGLSTEGRGRSRRRIQRLEVTETGHRDGGGGF